MRSTQNRFAFLYLAMVVIGCQRAAARSLYPWCDPCGGSNPVPGTEGQGGTGGNVNTLESLQNIVNSAKEAEVFARILKTKYNNNSNPHTRILDSSVPWYSAIHLDNMPHSRHNQTVNEALQQDFTDVSTLVVFMEAIHQDERTSTAVYKFTHEMDDFESSLYATLCKIKIAADARQLSLSYVTRDVMPSYYRNIGTTANRYARDYIVFKDAEAYLKALAKGY